MKTSIADISNAFRAGSSGRFGVGQLTGGLSAISNVISKTLTKTDISNIQAYNAEIEAGTTAQTAFYRTMQTSSKTAQDLVASFKGGKVEMAGLTTATNTSKLAIIGLKVATVALNMAIMMGLASAIQALVTGLNNLIHAAKNASEEANELASQSKDNANAAQEEVAQLDELIAKYEELARSDTSDATVRNEIRDVQSQIVDLTGEQAAALDLVNGKLDEELTKLYEAQKLAAQTAVETATSAYHAAKEAADKAIGEDSFLFVDGYAYTGKREKDLEKILKDAGYGNNVQSGGVFGNTLFVMDTFDNELNELETAAEKAEYLQGMIDTIKDNYADYASSDLYNSLVEQRDAYLEYADAQREAAAILADSVIVAQTYDDELKNMSVDSVESFMAYRDKLIDLVANSGDLSEALSSGDITESDIDKYVTEYLATLTKFSNYYNEWQDTYVNANGDVLCEIYVDRGSNAPDPVATGIISAPTLNSDAQYDYTWSGWDNLSEMLSARTITATYDTTVRTYTVTWYSRAGLSLGSVEAEYGSEAVYSGDIPTNTEEEGMYIYNVFAGWNKSTGYITGDTDVYAIWDRAELPSNSKDLSEMSPAEIYAVATSGRAGSYFSLKDYTDIMLGHDFDFENVESIVLCENKVFDGKTAIDTNIVLFGADSPSFTLAIDFRFSDTTANNTLLSCFEEDGSEGFRLRYSSYPQIQWGDKTSNFGCQKYRDIVVLRHRKGDDKMYIYASNSTATPGGNGLFDTSIVSFESTRTRSTETDATITLGAVKYPDGGYDYYGSGVIYWCKLWYDDLGADNAKQLASWYHETLRMEYCGTERYRIGTSSTKCNASFIANNELTDRLYRMNATNINEGGWNDSLMRTFVNERVYDALPTVWKAMIKTVRVPTSAGSQSSEIVYAYDNIYLESFTALFNNTSEPYVNESSYISWYTSDIRRAKYRGFIIPDDASYYTGANEPSTVSTNTVKVGDVWKESTTNVCHILITAEDFARLPWTSSNGKYGTYTQDRKHVWITAYYWWLRSPYVGNSTYFWNVNVYGIGYYSGASNAFGVCPCFSI